MALGLTVDNDPLSERSVTTLQSLDTTIRLDSDLLMASSSAAGCDVWNDVFQQFPPNGIGNLWTRTDLAMASTSMMVVAANPNDASNGYYLVRPH